MVIDPVDNKVGEPRILSRSLEKLVKELKRFLAKVISKEFKRHQSRVIKQRLSKESEAIIINLIVSHINMNQTLID